MGFSVLYAILMAYGVAILFPETRIGHYLKGLLIDRLAMWLNTLTWSKVVFAVAFVTTVVSFAPAFPADVVFLVAADTAVYAEIAAILMLSQVFSHIRAFPHRVRLWTNHRIVQPLRLAIKGARQHRSRPSRKAGLDKTDAEDRTAGLEPSSAQLNRRMALIFCNASCFFRKVVSTFRHEALMYPWPLTSQRFGGLNVPAFQS
ncbi:hypothetical protein [Asticcacaulis excentricus]|uniref:Uncharacterized protein n=1 Tax=Asticcacaulis excentricus (strain ATCC 15261 / DSM 4724 / KCTC 12464 / NCIMB 9791 / VKM B-1370 / CB 48) TaxID=573065 RepID=E8RSM7_ASTEC|nr:hypothetical protein [Asticcacaulis excentricus]ADU14498.1 hypothetical protein Astex_2861 [Asticcacaulis excentricus CB 48]